MGGVRLGRRDHRIRFEAAPPRFTAGLGARQEVAELDRRVAIPDTTRAPKVRDARLGADTGAGERDDSARAGQQRGEPLKLNAPGTLLGHSRRGYATAAASARNALATPLPVPPHTRRTFPVRATRASLPADGNGRQGGLKWPPYNRIRDRGKRGVQ